MIRKLMVIFLSGAICLGLVASSFAIEYKQAPMLKIQVDEGKLPPVAERLPEEPVVVEPVEEIGQYGGTFRGMSAGPDNMALNLLIGEGLVQLALDYVEVIPNIIKGWEWNEDSTEVTLLLRKGMKWSDGYAFTADDLLFWYENIHLNDELSPVKTGWFKSGGEFGVLRKIDEYTMKWKFAAPYGSFIGSIASFPGREYHYDVIAPKHYLEQFHPDYTSMEEIEKIMKEEDFDTWMNLFSSKNSPFDNPERPTVFAWKVLNDMSSPMQLLERNPYYWKVDTEGNQLPYMDRIERILLPDIEARLLKTISGELDLTRLSDAGGGVNYPIVMQNREKGDYRVLTFEAPWENRGVIQLNMHHKDPVLRELFLDKKFRTAVSVALNREEISQIVFQGFGTPSQVAPSSGYPYYGEGPVFKVHTQYDPELANELLDEIGLTERDSEGYRLRPDGKEMLLILNPSSDYPDGVVDMTEMYKKYLNDVGIKTVVKPLGLNLFRERASANEYDVLIAWGLGVGKIFSAPDGMQVPLGGGWYFTGPLWDIWMASDGEAGIEPPEEIKRTFDLYQEFIAAADVEKRNALALEITAIRGPDNLFQIGGLQVGGVNSPAHAVVVSNRLGNVPDVLDAHLYSSQRSSWFIKK